MKIGVIGAGSSGLTTIKQLRDEGHAVVCFEKNSDIGGIWYRHDEDDTEMKAFDDMMLTISMKIMSFSDFMVEDRVFATRQKYFEYLQAYADKFELRSYIQFGSVVESVQRTDNGWAVRVTHNGRKTEHLLDAVAICTGPFKTPNLTVPDLENFDGEVIHSSRYRNNRQFEEQRVLVVGLAESGADIVRQVSDVSASCTLSIQSRSFLFPRIFAGGYATDAYTMRAHHYELYVRATETPFPMKAFFEDATMTRADFYEALRVHGVQAAMSQVASSLDLKVLGTDLEALGATEATIKAVASASDAAVSIPAIAFRGKPEMQALDSMGQPLCPPKIDLGADATKEVIDYINEWNRKSHHGTGTYSPKAIFCKNVSFVPNILNGRIDVNDSGIEGIRGKTVHFKDGTAQDYDTIILCTGFAPSFPSFLHGVEVPDNNVRNLFKHSIHPEEDGTLAFIGFVRPFTGGIPVCAEMQARYFALLCSRKRTLPSDVRERIAQDKCWEEEWTQFSPRHSEAVPSQILYLDSLAREIGCLPTCVDMLEDPELLVKMWFYAFNQSSYRLTGPHSNRDDAVASIRREQLPRGGLAGMFTFMAASLLPPAAHAKDQDMIATDDGVAPF
jgi:dimethylaniline monooxygenase (N-oxide forming)